MDFLQYIIVIPHISAKKHKIFIVYYTLLLYDRLENYSSVNLRKLSQPKLLLISQEIMYNKKETKTAIHRSVSIKSANRLKD